ncbi:flavodoxin family protein [Acetanaerobacterium elongatum]|uniref:NADPH-dependent FMN reductase n=1 Tax=Acetanaerobacterium elongatum TaxID=258515 RepID=A0A1G9XV64_9FIRM|nr:flavodoxin family protein [Acetanaerobacterium elongatum]SDN00688.1 NADPH-dependent FMN reductase [Acetanaerobacterium elongatum]
MKAVIVNGSYHQNGVTALMVHEFIRGLKESKSGIEVEEVNLSQVPLKLCKGCGCCVKNDGKSLAECPQPDYPAIKGILQDMIDCDILVYASPVYEKAVTALLKRFLERSMTILYLGETGPVPRNAVNDKKVGVVLVSCGTPFPVNRIQGITKYPLDILGMFCRGFGCSKVKKIEVTSAYSKEQVSDKQIRRVYKLAVKLGSML